MLVHMSPQEVASLQTIARSMGTDLTVNPDTGQIEAWRLSDFLNTLTGGKGLSGFISNVGNTILNNPQLTSAVVGTTYGLIKGDLRKGLEMGMKAYAGSTILGGIASTLQGAKGTPPISPGTAQPSTGGPFGEIEPAESAATAGGASRPATLPTVQTTTQQPSQQGGILSNLTNKFQTDPIFKAIALYALNKAETRGQTSNIPAQQPYQYRNVQYTKGTVNPRWREPGQPYFIGGGFTDYGMTTQYPGYNQNPAAQPQPTVAPPQPTDQPTGPLPYGLPMAAGGMVPADEGTIPAPNRFYPMANIKSAGYATASQQPRSAEILGGYDTAVDPFTGEEVKSQSNFADGGTVEEQNNLADYFQRLRPFAPALSDQYRSGALNTGIGSLQGVNTPTATSDLRPVSEPLAEYYRSLLQPPGTSRPPIDLSDYFNDPTAKTGTRGFTTPVPPSPTPTTPATTIAPPVTTTQFPICPPGTKFSAINYAAGIDPCVPDPPCPSGLVRDSDGNCTEPRTTTPKPSPTPTSTNTCPAGFRFDASLFLIGLNPCVPDEPCPSGLVKNEKGECVEPQSTKPGTTTPKPTNTPGTTDICPVGFTFDPSRFEIGLDPCIPNPCPSGLVRNEKGECVEPQSTKPGTTTPKPTGTSSLCPEGFTFDPSRFEIGLDPCVPDRPCPSGLVKDSDGNCVEPQSTKPGTTTPKPTGSSDFCPEGFIFDFSRFEIGLDPCVKINTTTPEPTETPKATTPQPTTTEPPEPNTTKPPRVTPPPISGCGEGYEYSPELAPFGIPCVPSRTQTPQPTDECPAGQHADPHGNCINANIQFRKKVGECDEGFTDGGDGYCYQDPNEKERGGGEGGGGGNAGGGGSSFGDYRGWTGGTGTIPAGGMEVEYEPGRYTKIKATGGVIKSPRKYANGGIANLDAGAMNPIDGYNFGFAQGGMAAMPEYKAGGKLLRGPGDGMSDDIPAVIRGKTVQRAALADGEFVIPADVVSHLGNGSTDAGAKKLYKMMEQIRRARTGRAKQAPRVNTDKFLPRA